MTQQAVPKPSGHTPKVSVVDFVALTKKNMTAQEVNKVLKAAAEGPLMSILAYTEDKTVSTEMQGNPNASIIHADKTKFLNGNLVKVVSRYDIERGYSNRVGDLI